MPIVPENTDQERHRIVRERFREETEKPRTDLGTIAERIAPMEESKQPVEHDQQTRERLREIRGWDSNQQAHAPLDLSKLTHFENERRPDALRELRHQEVLEERTRLELQETEQLLEQYRERRERGENVEAHERNEARGNEPRHAGQTDKQELTADAQQMSANDQLAPFKQRVFEFMQSMPRDQSQQQQHDLAMQRQQEEQQQRQTHTR